MVVRGIAMWLEVVVAQFMDVVMPARFVDICEDLPDWLWITWVNFLVEAKWIGEVHNKEFFPSQFYSLACHRSEIDIVFF